MSRLTTAILGQNAFGRNAHQPMLDLTFGGQGGYSPNLEAWNNNGAYIRKPLIPILLEAPRFFSLMPEPQKWVETLRALIELHPLTIEGFKAGLTVEFEEHRVGGAGEVQAEVTDVKREKSDPVFTYVEKYGMAIQTFLSHWIQYGMMDPETKFALIGTLTGQRPDDLLADWYTCTCLFIEPDPTHRRVVKSWVSTNMMPKGTGDIIGKRDNGTASELNNLSIEFTALSQFSLGTSVFAQKILDTINITRANPYMRPSFVQNISSDVEAANTTGYKLGVEALAASALPGIVS